MLNPISYTLGNFDAMGRWQTTNEGVSADGTPFSIPVDSVVAIPTTDLAGTLSSGVELSQKLAVSPQARGCLAQKWFTHATGRPLATEDACTMTRLTANFETSKGDMRALVLEVATSAPTLYIRGAP